MNRERPKTYSCKIANVNYILSRSTRDLWMNRRCFMGYSMPGDSNKVLSPVKITEMRDVVKERNWTTEDAQRLVET